MPKPASFLFGLSNLLWLKNDQLGFYAAMQARHGDAVPVRVGPYRMWLLFHPDAIEAVLTAHASAFIRFEPVMRILAQWNGQSLIISEGDRWRARRRQVLPAFASRRLPGYGDRIVARTLAFLDGWAASTVDGVLTTDTDRAMAALALDVAVDTLFDKQMGGEAASIGTAVAALSDVAFQESTSLFRLPAWLQPPGSRKRRAMAQMDHLVTGIVTERLSAQASDRGDLLSTLTAQDDDAVAIRDEVMTLLIAGHETSGALLTWASLALSQHPPVLQSLQAELDTVLRKRPPTAADLPAMPVLRSVIEEALRLYPPGYGLFPRRSTADLDIGGSRISRGDLVQIVPFTTQRDARWFPDPSAFRPERFRQEPTWPRYAYLPFGAGPRVCIGQSFGLMETALILATMLQQYTPLPPTQAVVLEPKFSLRPRGGLVQEWRAVSTRI